MKLIFDLLGFSCGNWKWPIEYH